MQERPYFLGAVNAMVDGGIVPVPGGVLIRDGDGEIVGAVGITGDTSENDEACAIAGIEAAGACRRCRLTARWLTLNIPRRPDSP